MLNPLNTIIDYKDFAQGVRFDYKIMNVHDITDGANPERMIEFRLGGFGSDLSPHPVHPNQFYALTDRGPNTDYNINEDHGKKFLDPIYCPRIGHFELTHDGKIIKIKEILLKTPQGKNITGLPNAHFGANKETAYDRNGQRIVPGTDEYGLDSEALVALKDGTFWVSDEYGPHLVHFNAEGVEIDRINAYEQDSRRVSGYMLPLEYSRRRQNRGMEGLDISSDQTRLVGIMQSAMSLPNASVNAADLTRILMLNLVTGKISQYLYRQEASETVHSNTAIMALNEHQFLVSERDDDFYKDNPKAFKRIFKIEIQHATDLEAIQSQGLFQQDEELGLLIRGLTPEQYVLQHGWDGLEQQGIHPVSKTLVLDLIEKLKYPHDKIEGLWLIDQQHLAILNDDDYAFSDDQGVIQQKYLDNQKTIIDGNTLYVVADIKLNP